MRPNDTGSPPVLESKEIKSGFLFAIHFLLCLSTFHQRCYVFRKVYLNGGFREIFADEHPLLPGLSAKQTHRNAE